MALVRFLLSRLPIHTTAMMYCVLATRGSVSRKLSMGDGLPAAGHWFDNWSSLLATRKKSAMSVMARDGGPETRRYKRTTVSTLPPLTA